MVKALCWLLLACLFSPAVGAMMLPDRSPMTAAAQDGTGTVWAFGKSDALSSAGAISRWEAGAWQGKMLPEAKGFMPRTLAHGDNGSVYGLWQTREETTQWLITVHRGNVSRVLARFPAPELRDWGSAAPPSLWAGAAGDVWVAGSRPILWHISSAGEVTIFPLRADEFFGGSLPGEYDGQRKYSLVDSQGRRWFWQDNEAGIAGTGALRGVLIWDGKQLTDHAALPGLPDRRISLLRPLDADHLWLFTPPLSPTDAESGLYQVDTRTLTAFPVIPPAKGAFQNVTQIFHANASWYVMEAPPDSKSPAILWRMQKGQWKKCLTSLKNPNGLYDPLTQPPWLAVPSGTWLGEVGGAWWLSKDNSPAVWVDWRRGLPVGTVTDLFGLNDGRMLVFGSSLYQFNQGTAMLPPTPLPLYSVSPEVKIGNEGAPEGIASLTADPRGHLWGTRCEGSGPGPLAEWDGRRWQTHYAPDQMGSISGLFACDTQSRVWLNMTLAHGDMPPTWSMVIYDPIHETWTNYSTFTEALQASAALPGLTLMPNSDPSSFSRLSGEGKATYTDRTKIFLYDGHEWRHWEAREIEDGYNFGNVTDTPKFNRAGGLEIALSRGVWEWTTETGWHTTGRPGYNYSGPSLPPGGPVKNSHRLVTDSQGAGWLTWQGSLWETRYGLWAKQDALSGPGSPFWDGRAIDYALHDAEGRLFFVTRPAGDYDIVAWQPVLPPAPKIQIIPRAEDAVTIRFSTPVAARRWFLWRMNGGEWSAPQKEDAVALTALPGGNYRVEAQILDNNLQASAKPSAAFFTIHVKASSQVARWVQILLTGNDDARETAVRGLGKQPGLALPALQAARRSASEEAQWWIDAAIQQIEDANAQKDTP